MGIPERETKIPQNAWPRTNTPTNECNFISSSIMYRMGLPGGSVVKNLPANAGGRFKPGVGKIPWRRKWQPTPVFLPHSNSGKSHGQRSVRDYGPWGHERVRHNRVTEHTRNVPKAPKLRVLGAPSPDSPTLGGVLSG